MFYFTPLRGFFSPFPHGTRSLSVTIEYLALEDGPPGFRQGFSCPALLRNSRQSPFDLTYGTITVFGAAFQPASDIDRISYFAHDFEIVADCPTTPLYATPQSLHVYGLGSSRFARHYYGNLG
jgi:hypothetical protein